MRWQERMIEIGKLYKKEGFLWFPKCIDGDCRWLEYAKWEGEYVASFFEVYWTNTRWIDD